MKQANQRYVEKEAREFTEITTTIATEATEIVLNGLEALNLILADQTMASKVRDSVAVISKSYTDCYAKILSAGAEMGEIIEENLSEYEGAMVGFAMRHPIDAMKLDSLQSKIKGSWDKLSAIFSPESETSEKNTQKPAESGMLKQRVGKAFSLNWTKC